MSQGSLAFSDDWKELKSEHFIIQYSSQESSTWGQKVLREAERYYDKIATQLGYARYQNFWTWENRAKIVVYANQEDFMQKTGQPFWSRGGAVRDHHLFQTRAIITYKQEAGFLDGVLPHEISHLILRDFIGFDKGIPIWFDEGIAQLQENGKKDIANSIMLSVVRHRQHIPLNQLTALDIRTQADPKKVAIFYAQSVSVIDFLIERYGSQRFGQLCRFMKDGKTFEEALKGTYFSILNSTEELEKKWLNHMTIE